MKTDLKGWGIGRSQQKNRVGKEFEKCRMDLRGWILGWVTPVGKGCKKRAWEGAAVALQGWGFLRTSSGWGCLTPVQTPALLWV